MTGLWYIVNVEAAVVREGRYLGVVRSERESRAPGVLTLPGGKVEDAGNAKGVLEGTLQRELLEEVGIEVADGMAYVESNAFVADDGEPVVDVVFLCRYRRGTPAARDPEEVASVEWMTAQEIIAHPRTSDWTRQSIGRAEAVRAEKGW